MYKVYKHTNKINGKVYIGITAQTIESRWRNGNGYTHSPHFYSAIKKYGWHSFEHEILFDKLTKEEAETKEIELIAIYNSTDPKHGYNCDSGGNVNRCHSEETKNKIRNAHIGMKYNAEFCKKQSELKKGNKNRLGQKQSEECKQKISQKNKGRFTGEKNYFHTHKFEGKNHPGAKAVDKYDLNGNLIETRESAEAFSREMNKINASHITEVCKGKRKTAYGFIWKYSEVN